MYSILSRTTAIIAAVCISAMASAQNFQHNYKYQFQNPNLDDEQRIENLISLMTLDEKLLTFGGEGVPRLGVRAPGSIEAIHGVVLGGPAWGATRGGKQAATVFPQGYGLGETWDREIIHSVGETMAHEARYLYQSPKYRKAGLVLWAPNSDLGRDIRWGRTEECYGEDPYLSGELTVAMVKGLQGDHPKYWAAASLMKHFLANSNEYGRTETTSDFDEALFRDYYSYPFRKGIVEGGANGIMTSYNEYNGIPCTMHPVLRDVVMKEWGLDGKIITDAGGLRNLVTSQKVFDRIEEAAAACIKAGTNRFLDNYKDALKGALREGLITEKDLDENMKGSFRVMLRLGLLDNSDENPYINIGVRDTIDPWTTQTSKDFARLVACKSAVLLKNGDVLPSPKSSHPQKPILPLDKTKIKKIAVVGNRADVVLEDWYCGDLPYKITPLDAVKELAEDNGIEVRYVLDDRRGEAQKTAEWADVVLVFVGNEPTCSPDWGLAPWAHGTVAENGREDVDRGSINLEQEDLVKMVYKSNPNTVLVLISSFPYAINWSQAHLPAILHITQSCQELGHAITDVLFGDYNPAGRTTQTWITSLDELPNMLDYDIRHGRTYMYYQGRPLYPFGFGLSYTTFEYSGMKLSKNTLAEGESIEVSVDVKNTGSRSGEEVVQLYVSTKEDDAAKRLRGFERVSLASGETKTITLHLRSSDILPAGKLTIMLGASSQDIRLAKTVSREAHVGKK